MALSAQDPRAAEAEQRRYGLQEWEEEAAKGFQAQLRRPQGEARVPISTGGACSNPSTAASAWASRPRTAAG